MSTLPLTVRLFAAVTAVTVTVALLGAVVSIAEPQRSVLIAKTQHVEPQQSSTPIALAMAPSSNGTTRHTK